MAVAPVTADRPDNDATIAIIRTYRLQDRKAAEEHGALGVIAKKAKADGLNVKAMKAALRAIRLDPDTVAQDLRDQLHYMSLLRMPLEPTDLFDGWSMEVSEKTRHEDNVWDAQDRGYQAGKTGQLIDSCPYPEGGEFAQAWRTWWHNGQAAIARTMGPNAKMADPSRTRPKRGRQASMTEVVALPRAKAPKASRPKKVAGKVRKPARKRGRPAPHQSGNGNGSGHGPEDRSAIM